MEKIEEQLIKDNQGLIWEITKKFYNIDKNDLFQAGALGMIKAYRNYKHNKDTKFSTYAYEYIYGEMYALANQKAIKIGKDIKKIYNMIEKSRFDLAQELGYIPTNYELSQYLGIEEDKINMAIISANKVISLDDDNPEKRSLHEEIPYEERINTLDKIFLNDCLDELDDKERNIITSRYYEDLTQSETAEKLGLTQVMVSRYEQKSLKKMRDYMYM